MRLAKVFLQVAAYSTSMLAFSVPSQAQTTTMCQTGASYPTQSITINGVSNAAVVATNAYGVAQNGGSLCLDIVTADSSSAKAGDFGISSNTSTSLGYPNILKGQTYGESSSQSGMPIKVRDIGSWPTNWQLERPTPSSSEMWNNIIEFWLTTYQPSGSVNQADGTELLVWLGASGVGPAGDPLPSSTSSSTQVTIGNVLWDVIGGRAWWGTGPQYWNYIAYRPANGVMPTSINTDFKAFFDDAKTRKGGCKTGPGAVGSGDTGASGFCAYDDWYVTSVQAGFEVWKNGIGLKSKNFSSTASVGSGLANGTYKIVSRNGGKVLDAYNLQTANGTQIIQWEYWGGANQQWKVTDTGGGKYSVIGVQSGRALDIYNSWTGDGTKIELWDYWGGPMQLFTITPTDSGYYRMTPQNATNSCVDVEGISQGNGANVHLWTWVNGINQQWAFQAP